MNRRDSDQHQSVDPSPQDQWVRARIFLGMVAVVIATVLAAPARGDDILAHGTDEMFWVARIIVPPPDSNRTLRTVIRGRAVGADAQWTDVGQLGSRVTSLANRGTQLAALLETGSWMLLWPNGSSVGAPPRDGARLLELAGDGVTIWSIGAGGSGGAAPASTAPATTAPTQPVATTQPHPDGLSLYRLDRGEWAHVASLPQEIAAADVERASFAVIGQSPTIAVLREGGTIQTYSYSEPPEAAAGWTTLPPIHAPDAQRIRLLRDGEGAIAWIAPEIGAGRLYAGQPRRWSDPHLLRAPEEIPADAPRTVALAGQNVRLLFIRDGATFEQTFSRDGSPLTDVKPIRTTVSTTTDALPSRIVTLAAAAMLMMVVLSSLRRGAAGTSAPPSIGADAGVAPAPLLQRLAAGLIDASPLLITWWIVFRDIDPNVQPVEELLARTGIPFYISLAAYLLYTWLAETFFARTVGKALFGLRVATTEGTRPGAGAIFARNALRLVDVMMIGIPLLLVLLSPLRQRVGDIAARTVVVTRVTGKADDSEPSQQGSSSDADEPEQRS